MNTADDDDDDDDDNQSPSLLRYVDTQDSTVGGIKTNLNSAAIRRLSVRQSLSVPCFYLINCAFYSLWGTNRKQHDESRTHWSAYSVAVRPSEVTETATKLSLVPLQKHTLGGCTIDATGIDGGIRYRFRRLLVSCFIHDCSLIYVTMQ